MSNENELLEPLATEAGQQAIAAAIRGFGSLENALRAERAAETAIQKASDASDSATAASGSATLARNWATKIDTYVDTETITIPAEEEGEEDTTETVQLFSARYYALMAQDIYNNLQFDSVPTENSMNIVSSGTVYDALDLKADKSTTYTKTEIDTALATKQDTLTIDNSPTENSTNLVKSGGVYAALEDKADNATTLSGYGITDAYTKSEVDSALGNVQSTLTFDSTPTQNSTNPVTSGGLYTAFQNVQSSLTFDNAPTQNSDNPVKSGGIYTALAGKQDTLTFDSSPTANSDNPVKSSGIKTALDGKADSSSVPTKVSDLTNDSGFITGVAWNDVSSKPTFATVATSGSYSDLSNTPTIPTVPTNVSDFTNDAGYITGVSWSDVTSKPTFATVATSGSYTDLTDKPTIPSAYTLPTASSSTLGGIKVGTNLSIDNNGVLSASGGSNVTVDTSITENSTNPVTSAAIYAALQNAGSNITVDSTVTENSQNPVTSAGIYDAIENAVGAGSLASGIVEDTLFKSSTGVASGTINLSGNISDYDLIQVFTTSDNTIQGIHYQHDDCYLLTATDMLFTNQTDARVHYRNLGNSYILYNIENDNTMNIKSAQDIYIIKITGIKFSKNLSEQMYSNVLYENSSGVYSGTITLNDNFDNYDFISVEIWDGQNGNGKNQCYYSKEFLQQCKEDDKFIISIRFHESQVYYKLTNLNTITFGGYSGNCKLYKITGYKMAKGGYSGIVSDARMTVKSGVVELSNVLATYGNSDESVIFDSPMPDTNYVVSVSREFGGTGWVAVEYKISNKTVNGFTLTINNQYNYATSEKPKFSWIAIRPNSYTREGMVEDVLFSNASGVGVGTVNLNGNISDYDIIEFTKIANNSTELYAQRILSSDLITRNASNKQYIIEGYDNRHISMYYVNDTQIAITAVYNELLIGVKGIKFGRYVSGVAVDTTVTQNSNAVVTSGAVYDALQNIPSGGGSSVTVDSTITQNSTNPVESAAIYTALAGKQDTLTIDASPTQNSTNAVQSGGVYTALASKQDSLTFDSSPTENSNNPVKSGGVYTALASKGDVTTSGDQNITGTKTFVGEKKIKLKQSSSSNKLGFTLYMNDNTERGYLEFNPTNTTDGVTGLLALGNYASNASGITQVGFRRYSNVSGANGAYNLLMPLIADAKTPFSLTTTYTNFYLPLGFTDGTTTVKCAKSGVVDLSPLLSSLEQRIAALEAAQS